MQAKYLVGGAALCAALLVASPTASAQSAAQQGYSQPTGSVQQQLGDAPHHRVLRPAVDSGGGLPFTGLDLGLVVVAGGVLLTMGFAIRRLARSGPA